jgi:uncharacterized protein (TIGR03437 family)
MSRTARAIPRMARGQIVGTEVSYDLRSRIYDSLQPTAHTGTEITILGIDLTGASSVTFNGASASFTVVSATEINATVPAGATTGIIDVTTPGGVLKSNVAFRVYCD